MFFNIRSNVLCHPQVRVLTDKNDVFCYFSILFKIRELHVCYEHSEKANTNYHVILLPLFF